MANEAGDRAGGTRCRGAGAPAGPPLGQGGPQWVQGLPGGCGRPRTSPSSSFLVRTRSALQGQEAVKCPAPLGQPVVALPGRQWLLGWGCHTFASWALLVMYRKQTFVKSRLFIEQNHFLPKGGVRSLILSGGFGTNYHLRLKMIRRQN